MEVLTSSKKTFLQAIILKGNEIFPGFRIDADQEFYYENMALYFMKDGRCAFDLKKNIIVCGERGTGKTLSMRVFRHIFRSFGTVEARHVIRDYKAQGEAVCDKYGRFSFEKNPQGNINYEKPISYCFEDLGLQQVEASHYGESINVINEILLDRYILYIEKGMKTYGTTNEDEENFMRRYSLAVADRGKEMLQFIPLTGESKRK